MLDPTEAIGAISSKLGDALSVVLSEITNPVKIPIDKLRSAVDADPLASACCFIKQARAMQLLEGNYKNPDPKIDKFIRHNLENIDGNISELTGRMSSAMPFGFAVSEVVYKKLPLSWKLDRFHYLDPTRITFDVKKGYCDTLEYNEGIKKKIPLKKTLHITNGLFSNYGYKYLFGTAEAIRAYPFIRLKQLIFGEMGVAAKRLATGILWGQADSNKEIIRTDSDGKTLLDYRGRPLKLTAVESLSQQLAKLENNSYIVTDKDNIVSALNVPAGEQFWNLALMLIDTQILRSFIVPDTIFQQGVASFGVGGLAAMQLNILDSSVQEIVKQIKEQLIEKVIKNLIVWNFGIQSNYGEFVSSESVDPSKEQATLSNLISVLSMGLVPTTDTEATNKLRELLGLSQVSPEEQKFQADLNSQLQNLQQQGQNLQVQEPVSQEEGVAA
jgi:hypothetical protein